ncbi:hypothetical protein GCK32_012957 [Trichostrongylus colubriformis]|uniref:Uncharacterized protein n=1 Tax=Trichostrongylus colubriformis TaxID=6319 RepID=A0AAN8FH13_TRICO
MARSSLVLVSVPMERFLTILAIVGTANHSLPSHVPATLAIVGTTHCFFPSITTINTQRSITRTSVSTQPYLCYGFPLKWNKKSSILVNSVMLQ